MTRITCKTDNFFLDMAEHKRNKQDGSELINKEAIKQQEDVDKEIAGILERLKSGKFNRRETRESALARLKELQKPTYTKDATLTEEEIAASEKDAAAAGEKSEERAARIARSKSASDDPEDDPEKDFEDNEDGEKLSATASSSLSDNPLAEAAAEAEEADDSKDEAEAQKILNEEEAKKAAARAAIPNETISMGGGPGAGFLRTPRAVMAQVAMRGGKTPAMKAAEQSATNASIAEINRLRKTDPEAAEAMQSAFTGRPSRTSSFPEGMEVVQTRDEGGETVSRSTRIAIPEKFGGGSAFGDTGKGIGTASEKGRFGDYGTGQNEFGSLTRDLMDSSFKPGTGIVNRENIRAFGRGTTGMGDLIAGPGGDLDRGFARNQAGRTEKFEKLKEKAIAADLAAKEKAKAADLAAKEKEEDEEKEKDPILDAAAKVNGRKGLMSRTMNRTMNPAMYG